MGANDRETYRARSKAEFIDSLREVEETAYWLELLADAPIVSAAKLQASRKEADELTAIFVMILKSAKG